jgi:lysophospholipase L1-like esterase
MPKLMLKFEAAFIREIKLDKPADTKRILILGDSYTFGVYIGEDDIYPSRLEKMLREESKRIEVINAGYADGWSPDEHYVWLAKRGLRFNPDLIIYGFFIGNDLTDINTDHWSEIDENGLPTKITNPDIYINESGGICTKIKDTKAVEVISVYDVPVIRESHFFVLVARKIDYYIKALVFKARPRRNWDENAFPFILKDKNDPKMDGQEKAFLKIVKAMSDLAVRNNAQFLILEIPINFQVDPDLTEKVLGQKLPIKRDYFSEINPRLDEMHIKYINLLERMKKKEGAYYPKNGEVHFNSEGHLFAARQLADYLNKEHF